VSSFFDYQYNCQPEPEKSLIWTFLTIVLDPLVPGMLEPVYALAWSGAGGVGGERELAFRASFHLYNLQVDPLEFVVTGAGPWFVAWNDSIIAGESDPFSDCPSLAF
jgi:hypothetical protein